jgi:hypothetical protein
MKNAILVLGQAELLGLKREFPDLMINAEIIALTADVYEASIIENIEGVTFPDWVQSIVTYDEEIRKKIESTLMRLEEESSTKRSKIFTNSDHKVDWNYIPNYLQTSLFAASIKLAKSAALELKKFSRINVVALHHPSDFYFDSAIPAALLCEKLIQLGLDANLLQLDERTNAATYRPQMFEFIPDLDNEKFIESWSSNNSKILIATAAIYSKADQQKLGEIINSNYKDTVPYIYPIPMWQVINSSKDFENKCTIDVILKRLSDADRLKCIEYSNWLTDKTEECLIECLEVSNLKNNPLFRLQISRLRKRHLYQCLTFIEWRRTLSLKRVEMLAITMQDSGVNGPLASAVLSNNGIVILFPHSKIINWPTPCDCLVATDWWQPSEPKSLWNEPNKCIYFDTEINSSIDKENKLSCSQWALLYNGTYLNVFNTLSWPFLKKIVQKVKDFTDKSNIQLIHRLKPGNQTPVNTFCDLLNIDSNHALTNLSKSLKESLESTELIIAVDEPSSALWEALSFGCAVILIVDRKLHFESILDHEIITAISYEEFEKLLDIFSNDSNALNNYRKQQQTKYLLKRDLRLN